MKLQYISFVVLMVSVIQISGAAVVRIWRAHHSVGNILQPCQSFLQWFPKILGTLLGWPHSKPVSPSSPISPSSTFNTLADFSMANTTSAKSFSPQVTKSQSLVSVLASVLFLFPNVLSSFLPSVFPTFLSVGSNKASSPSINRSHHFMVPQYSSPVDIHASQFQLQVPQLQPPVSQFQLPVSQIQPSESPHFHSPGSFLAPKVPEYFTAKNVTTQYAVYVEPPSVLGNYQYGQLMSTFIASFSYVAVVPSWANEMTPDVKVS